MAAPTINSVSPLDGAVNVAPDVPLVFKVTSNDAGFVTDYETLVATVNAQQVFANNQPVGGWTGSYQTLADGSRVYTLLPPEGFAYGAKVSAAFAVDYRVATDHLEFAEAPIVVDATAKSAAGFLTFADSVTAQDALIDGTTEKAFADTVTITDAATVATGGGGGVWTEVAMTGVLPASASVVRVSSMSGYSAHEIYINTSGQIAKWDGAVWTYLATIAADRCIFCLPGIIWACGHSAVASSVDNGVTWVNQPIPEVGAFGLNAIGGTASKLYIVGQSSDFTKRAWQSLDGGATWTQLFTTPSNVQLFSIFALADDNVFFSGGNGVVVQWDGATPNVVQGSTIGFTNYQIWSPGTTGGGGIDAYWCCDSHALPNKQIAHAVLSTVYEENGPYPTTSFPKVDLLGLHGNGPTNILACGQGTGGTLTGSRVYSLQTPSNLGPGTWIEEILPSGQLDNFAAAGAIWVDPSTGQVCVLANKDSGASSFAYTSYFKNQVP